MHDGMPYDRNQGQGQGHSREVDRQSPTGLIFAPVVTTTSIILSSNKIHNGDILVSANPGPPGKWPLKWKERERGVHHRSWGLPVGPHNSIKALKENLVNYRR